MLQASQEHKDKITKVQADKYSVSHRAELFHFPGEVEAAFGIWAAALMVAIVGFHIGSNRRQLYQLHGQFHRTHVRRCDHEACINAAYFKTE